MRQISSFSKFIKKSVMLTALCGVLAACGGQAVHNSAGVATVSQDPSRTGAVAGVGIEGQDIQAMTDQMMRDMLTNPMLANAANPPAIIVDSGFFVNDSTQRMNKDLITNRLRVNLNRASMGRMVFVGRNYAGMVQQERSLKREGVVDTATRGTTQAQAGADYRLGGTIASSDSRDARTGMMQRYTQITFEMVDLERGVIVWSGIYELSKAAADDVVYR
ncbi:penicillin-binding protein activator LpoB [Kordiimonas sp. SCSIO 12603]|uniref:penicillin-binding protein activator LpoB n=1 Tax=Kordiimonas sp. SCSIO 12603 TaxID=2829596 RepID=UPI0021034493|nr:penicillin-binding protein activator LpoB [Kordiimonas sp. SCSIO 12603]